MLRGSNRCPIVFFCNDIGMDALPLITKPGLHMQYKMVKVVPGQKKDSM